MSTEETKEKTHTYRRKCEDEGRDWSDVAQTKKAKECYQKAGRGKEGFFQKVSRRSVALLIQIFI